MVKQILCQYIEKENSYIKLENMRFDKWKPVQGNLLPKTAFILTLLAVLKEVIPNVKENQVKKSIEKKISLYG